MRWRKNRNRGTYYGQVYVLSNPAMPGLLKIGFTRRATRLRTDELSAATGVPMPFRIEYSQKVALPDKVEEAVHHALKSRRVNRNREFFKVSVDAAKREIGRAARKYGGKRRFGKIAKLFSVAGLSIAAAYYFPEQLEQAATWLMEAAQQVATKLGSF